MAKVGNHGRIVPRDKALLTRLYWDDGLGLIEIAARFEVSWTSVKKVFNELNIPRRPATRMRAPWCIDCRVERQKVMAHKLAKHGTGTRCHECLKKYKRKHAVRKGRDPAEVRAKKKALYDRWYEQGPLNPQGESQWIRKSKHLLRTTRRFLASRRREASPLPNEASEPAATSPT